MIHRKHTTTVVVGIVALFLAACGGGSSGMSDASTSIRVTSTAMPPMLSGEACDHPIPITGGCGGPYVMKVTQGSLPPGVRLDEETHGFKGVLLDDGDYAFTIQIDDTGCKPFASTSAHFSISVGVGALAVVDVLRDGMSSLIPSGETSFNPDYPALPTVVYNDFTSLQFLVAGGSRPYSMKVYDDPSIPNDGNLPMGVSLPAYSTSLVGAAVEVGPNGGPFLCSFQVTDSVGEKASFTAYWKVDTPVIIVATEGMLDGQAGVEYFDQMILAGGVPPFTHELVETGLPPDYSFDANPNPSNPQAEVLYNPSGPPTVNPVSALKKIDGSGYPAEADPGPSYAQSNPGVPAEGMYIMEETGEWSGIPRRRGTFSVNYHAMSALVPNSFGQHAWATYGFSVLGAPPIAQDPAYTLDSAFSPTQPYAKIPGADQGKPYNPDGGAVGLQLLASGGVPQDGRTDAPHLSQTSVSSTETEGAYQWQIEWDPDNEGFSAITAMELTPAGVFEIEAGREDDLIPQFDQPLAFTAIDFALPSQLATTSTEKVRFEIGPDRILLTKSNTSFTTNYDNRAMNDTSLTMQVLMTYGAGGDMMRDLNDSDLVGQGAGKIGIPDDAGTITLANLLKTMDVTRISINPTVWWDDNVHLNPRAARPFQHGDRNSIYAYYGLGYYGTTSYSPSTSTSTSYQWQPTAVCVRLPKTEGVTKNFTNGVYDDGGKFFIFETTSHIGVFIIRRDGRLYIPAAFSKSGTGWVSFGDNWNEARQSPGNSNSGTKIPQMTVSPDGRFAALKLRKDASYSQYESAASTGILLLSLTGEPVSAWGDEVYKVIGTGSNGSSSQGQYQFAPSLTLTNRYLYYLIGSGSSTYLHWKDHYIYRYDLFGGASAGSLLHPNFNSEWTNSAGNAMQTPFQDWYNPFYSYYGPNPWTYAASGTNIMETSYAPHPFRVNADGNACAILAARTTANTAGSDVMTHHVWIDFEGSLHQLSSLRRRTSGGGRGTSLFGGPMYYPTAWAWGAYDGPTTRLEISDDGTRVAVAYNRSTYVYGSASYSTYPTVYRSDIAAYSTTTDWTTHTTHEITGDSSTSTSPSTAKFSTPHTWRFGALTFTADGEGLIFWGGYSNYSPTATYQSNYYMYYGAKSYVGSLYSYDFSDSSVRNILSSSYGGCNKTVGSAFTSTSFSTSSWVTDGGVIKPTRGFLSMNREFYYIATRGAITSSSYRDGTLIGVNVRSLDTTQSVNGHTDGRAFLVGGFNGQNGFFDGSYPYHYMGLGYYYYYPGYYWYYAGNFGGTQRVTSTDNGWVFFVSTISSTSYTSAASSSYGGAVNYTYYTYPYYPKRLYVFDPNVGGDVQEIGASTWNGGSSYHLVGCVEVTDDGHNAASIYSAVSTALTNDREQLRIWSGIDLDGSGDLIGSPYKANLESGGTYIGSHVAFSPSGKTLYYAAGSGNENAKKLKAGSLEDGSTTEYAFSSANYCVLHAGR